MLGWVKFQMKEALTQLLPTSKSVCLLNDRHACHRNAKESGKWKKTLLIKLKGIVYTCSEWPQMNQGGGGMGITVCTLRHKVTKAIVKRMKRQSIKRDVQTTFFDTSTHLADHCAIWVTVKRGCCSGKRFICRMLTLKISTCVACPHLFAHCCPF